MTAIDNLIAELSEDVIARRVGGAHDAARAQYQLRANTVADFDSFIDAISDYYSYHFQRVNRCGPLPDDIARQEARNLLAGIYRQNQQDINNAFNDASDSVSGGLRIILDQMANAFKFQQIEQYIISVFDRYYAPNDWDAKVEIITQFITCYGHALGETLRTDRPESYASNPAQLIRAYVDGLRRASSVIRGL